MTSKSCLAECGRGLLVRTLIAIALVLAVALSLGGCAAIEDPQEPTIRVNALEPLIMDVLGRHDAYVAGDELLTQPEREIYLVSTELIRRALQEAKGPPAEGPPVTKED